MSSYFKVNDYKLLIMRRLSPKMPHYVLHPVSPVPTVNSKRTSSWPVGLQIKSKCEILCVLAPRSHVASFVKITGKAQEVQPAIDKLRK